MPATTIGEKGRRDLLRGGKLRERGKLDRFLADAGDGRGACARRHRLHHLAGVETHHHHVSQCRDTGGSIGVVQKVQEKLRGSFISFGTHARSRYAASTASAITSAENSA
jgi:hypothetical protein